jgi:Cof subfamily protein (haloacid dehalogenase superfamily)
MRFKAIFIDVDGTLLTDRLTILPGTIKVINRLSASGLLISLVTARSPDASLFLYEQLGIGQNPIICFNGALILQKNLVLYDEGIDTFTVQELIHELKDFKINLSIYRHRDWYTENIDHRILHEIEITHTVITRTNFNELVTTGFCPNKVLCMGEPDVIDAAENHLKKTGFNTLNIHKSKTTYLEIMNRNASKRQGIQKVLDEYKIHKDEIIAIGDNFNDIDMLSFASTSIAMGNAPEEVKKYATFITDTNNNEGIQKALDSLIPGANLK